MYALPHDLLEADDAEMRAFFARTLARAGSFEASGSVTLLAMMADPTAAAIAADPTPTTMAAGRRGGGGAPSGAASEPAEEDIFALAEFDGAPRKTRERIAALATRGIALSRAVLAKLGIAPPRAVARSARDGGGDEDEEDHAYGGGLRPAATRALVEVLTSIADGHATLITIAAPAGFKKVKIVCQYFE